MSVPMEDPDDDSDDKGRIIDVRQEEEQPAYALSLTEVGRFLMQYDVSVITKKSSEQVKREEESERRKEIAAERKAQRAFFERKVQLITAAVGTLLLFGCSVSIFFVHHPTALQISGAAAGFALAAAGGAWLFKTRLEPEDDKPSE